jgi:dCTP deaminase
MTSVDLGLLTDHEIVAARERGELGVWPFDPDLVRPAALGLRLGTGASVLEASGAIDVGDAATHPRLVARDPGPDGRLRLDPDEVLLAPTMERLSLSASLAGLLDGTSDYARLGISAVLSHQVSPGYGSDVEGGAILTLEIVSRLRQTVYLRPGTRIGNLMLFRCKESRRPYPLMVANYSRDQHVRASRLAEHHGC